MLTPGQLLQNRYQIIDHLGGGGMGDVYRAYARHLGNPIVIVKENRGGDAQMFQREAHLLAALKHPNLPRVLDHFVETNGLQYLVMDYIEGQNLAAAVKQHGAFLQQTALERLNQIFDAVNYLHAQTPPLIHRDIKPQNIIISPQGKAVLVDFGIAKQMKPSQYTGSSLRAVSPGYAPPEQYSGGTDERSDVYALGATLYFLLSSQDPPPATERAYGKPMPSLARLNRTVSAPVEKAIQKAMAMNGAQRFASVREFQNALTPTRVVPPPPPNRFGLPVAAWGVIGAAIVVVGLLGLMIGRLANPAAVSPTPESATQAALATQTVAALSTAVVSPTLFSTDAPTSLPVATATLFSTDAPTLIPPTTPTLTPTIAPTLPPVPTLGIGSTKISNIDGAEMVFVPAGEFTMGSRDGDAGAEGDEKPQHTVNLDAYWMDRFEVTNARYKKCVDAGKCSPPSESKSFTRDSYFGNAAFDNYPVIYVSWDDADAYCKWAGKRLPTEAEWEKAVRGTDARIYPWGNAFAQSRVNNAQVVGDTTEVGKYPNGASPYGALDMAGNVWEWVNDWYNENYYSSSPSNNPQGPASGSLRGLRGGSFSIEAVFVRAAFRDGYGPAPRFNNIGFRCVQ